ncbi:hypothetical protein [Synechococcus sp. PCC 7336]|nr:hypothetical protein [Synechococcus sp. PCC 7336]
MAARVSVGDRACDPQQNFNLILFKGEPLTASTLQRMRDRLIPPPVR